MKHSIHFGILSLLYATTRLPSRPSCLSLSLAFLFFMKLSDKQEFHMTNFFALCDIAESLMRTDKCNSGDNEKQIKHTKLELNEFLFFVGYMDSLSRSAASKSYHMLRCYAILLLVVVVGNSHDINLRLISYSNTQNDKEIEFNLFACHCLLCFSISLFFCLFHPFSNYWNTKLPSFLLPPTISLCEQTLCMLKNFRV